MGLIGSVTVVEVGLLCFEPLMQTGVLKLTFRGSGLPLAAAEGRGLGG